ncbi:MAG: homoserine dehydrogenase [Chloroflexi bacterium]|nr:homoserine dehydrogenase [Chloroflexota bacterium]
MVVKTVNVGLIGLGTIGTGVAKVLTEKRENLSAVAGYPLLLKKIADIDIKRPRPVKLDPSLLTTDAREILDNPDIAIVIELVGGENPARSYIADALKNGKSVVTANKEVIAKHGPELLGLAREHHTALRYEASVGGGIPLISPLQRDLAANTFSSIHAIINGTTNYILTKMSDEGLDFAVALKQAQELGYAEADPTNDVEGIDAAYKLAIMCTLAYHSVVRPADVYREGISRLTWKDFRYARELGYAIKLLAMGKSQDGALEARVHPVFIPENSLLAKVKGVFNAVQIHGDLVGDLILYGRGAGAEPTSSAVVADVIALAQSIGAGAGHLPAPLPDRKKNVKPISDIATRYYLRMNVADSPGVLAKISRVLGDHNISISAVIQKEVDLQAQRAEIVIMTHTAVEAAVQMARRELEKLDVVKEINNIIRVEG